MDDASKLAAPPQPAPGEAPTAEPLAPPVLEALRRFHHGDRAARPAGLPAALLPGVLVRLRAEAGSGGWPASAGAEGATETVAYGPRAHFELALAAARHRLERSRGEYALEARRLVATADAMLEADRARDPEAQTPEERGGQLGALGARFIDPARLAGVMGRRNAGRPFGAERRKRLASARQALAEFGATRPEPVLVAAASGAEACAAGAAAFDAGAGAIAPVARAARIVRLEAADAFDPERHLPALDRLDWRGFAREELALVPPVIVDLGGDGELAAALPAVSRLLLSGRPLQLVATIAADRPDVEVGGARLEPALLGLAHREAFVQQGSVARAEALARGFERALVALRAGLHVVDVPALTGGGADRVTVAAARVAGRAAPLFRYEPDAGPNWANRVQLGDNPEVGLDWPREPLGASPDAPAATPVTFADAALLDPAWREHFALADGDAPDLLPLAEWLAADPEAAAHRLPFVWGLAEGRLVRLVVDRLLAAATRERLAFWRSLQELAGVRNEQVEAAVARAERERAELAARHAEALDAARAEAGAAAVERVVAALLEVEPALAGAGGWALSGGGAAPAPPVAAAAPAAAGRSGAPAAAAPVAAEAWLDTPLCTSCDECVRKFPGIFAYNGDKQAFIKNPRGGGFRDLVLAAESCTARVIHPGAPWNPDEAGLPVWIERAKRFA